MQEDFEKTIEQERRRDAMALNSCDWLREEFSESSFMDKRLLYRLFKVAENLSMNPTVAISQASGGWQAAKAAYRFFDNSKVTHERILSSHIEQTTKRVKTHMGTILAIQDTSFLNYSHMTNSPDLGPIGDKITNSMGLIVHSGYAVTELGLPLGFFFQKIWARDPKKGAISKAAYSSIPIQEKESIKWINALEEQAKLFGKDRNVITVCDRECDIYHFFAKAVELKQQFVVRAVRNRSLEDGDKIFSYLEDQPIKGTYELPIPDSKVIATLSVKFAKLTLALQVKINNINNSPKNIKGVSVVYVYEKNPPQDREPISWMLLTNLAVSSIKKAKKIIQYYKQRWKIEVLHKIMKSGCSIELTRLLTNKRRFPFIALKSIIASRLLLITHYNKILPSEPASSILSPLELDALYSLKHNKKTHNTSYSAANAIKWLAELGGYLSRSSDPLPGPTHVWRGWQKLQDSTKMMRIMIAN